MNHIRRLLFALIVACCMPLFLYAQPGFDDDVDDDVPLDGGLSVLAVAGAAYGLKKIKDARKKKKEAEETSGIEK
jgi:hypothetical protein